MNPLVILIPVIVVLAIVVLVASARRRDTGDAIGVLAGSPMIGRPSDDGLRELVIGRGSRGYIARYEDDEGLDLVRVVRVWHQRERRG
jgi:plasmid stabilization system protein ParE